jgi:hypothetical protein
LQRTSSTYSVKPLQMAPVHPQRPYMRPFSRDYFSTEK